MSLENLPLSRKPALGKAELFASCPARDLVRRTDCLLPGDPQAALQTIDLIEEAVHILRHHPQIGRPVEDDLRELVISRGTTGYVALQF